MDENGRGYKTIYENLSGSMREGSGSPKNASNISYTLAAKDPKQFGFGGLQSWGLQFCATDFGSGGPLTRWEATVWEATVWEATVSRATDFGSGEPLTRPRNNI